MLHSILFHSILPSSSFLFWTPVYSRHLRVPSTFGILSNQQLAVTTAAALGLPSRPSSEFSLPQNLVLAITTNLLSYAMTTFSLTYYSLLLHSCPPTNGPTLVAMQTLPPQV